MCIREVLFDICMETLKQEQNIAMLMCSKFFQMCFSENIQVNYWLQNTEGVKIEHVKKKLLLKWSTFKKYPKMLLIKYLNKIPKEQKSICLKRTKHKTVLWNIHTLWTSDLSG